MGNNDDRMDPFQLAIFIGVLAFVGVLYAVNEVTNESQYAMTITLVIIAFISLGLMFVFRNQLVQLFGPIIREYLFGTKKTNRSERKTLTKGERMHVWKKYNGERFTGKCYSCKREISVDNFEVGHNIALAKGGANHFENYRPICALCNRSMGTKSIEDYKKFFEETDKDSSTAYHQTLDDSLQMSKKELVNSLTKPQMRKIIRVLDLDFEEEWDGDEKEDYVKFLISSRKASVKNIQKIIEK